MSIVWYDKDENSMSEQERSCEFCQVHQKVEEPYGLNHWILKDDSIKAIRHFSMTLSVIYFISLHQSSCI